LNIQLVSVRPESLDVRGNEDGCVTGSLGGTVSSRTTSRPRNFIDVNLAQVTNSSG
jgi:hypothetical protein